MLFNIVHHICYHLYFQFSFLCHIYIHYIILLPINANVYIYIYHVYIISYFGLGVINGKISEVVTYFINHHIILRKQKRVKWVQLQSKFLIGNVQRQVQRIFYYFVNYQRKHIINNIHLSIEKLLFLILIVSCSYIFLSMYTFEYIISYNII